MATISPNTSLRFNRPKCKSKKPNPKGMISSNEFNSIMLMSLCIKYSLNLRRSKSQRTLSNKDRRLKCWIKFRKVTLIALISNRT